MNIKLNLNIFLFILLFFLTNQLEIYALVMIFALIHEVVHMICGVILGFKTDTLRIMPFGFEIEFKPIIDDYNKKVLKSNVISIKKIIIALAGPLINFIIVIIGLILNFNNEIIYANFLIFMFNLIPIYPLDGGKILKNILKIFLGNRKANTYTNTIANVVIVGLTMISSILIMIYKNIAILAILIVLWAMIIKENKKYNTYNKIYKTIDKSYNYL